ncbi:MAG: hypothetical protein LBJ23_01575, partial [Tannerella sp.]|nr:hypothetical protein [Tannerella sp.]
NRNADADVILFSGVSTIVLTEELPVVTGAVTVDGGTEGVVIRTGEGVNAANPRRIFTFDRREDSPYRPYEVELVRLTLAGGHAELGGAVYNKLTVGKMTLTDCLFTGNRAEKEGGAVWSSCHTEIGGCTFEENESAYLAGAVSLYYPELVPLYESEIKNSVFRANKAGYGGAVFVSALRYHMLHISDCLFFGNEAENAGGAVHGGNVTIRNSTFAGNYAKQNGGAVRSLSNENSDRSCILVNTTFTGNRADRNGGAVCTVSDTGPLDAYNRTAILYCTFVSNEAGGNGGALYAEGIHALNSIFTGNSGRTAESSNIFIYNPILSMSYCATDGGVVYVDGLSSIGDQFVVVPPPSSGNVTATVHDVFGVDAPQLTDNHVIEISNNASVAHGGRVAGILHTDDVYFDPYLYYMDAGKWKPINAYQSEREDDIVLVDTDKSGNVRPENCISMGAWQYQSPDAVRLPDESDVEILAGGSMLTVRTGQPVGLEVYDAGGRTALRRNIPEGATAIPLPPGIYIVKAGGKVAKVVLKR